jgi:tetratricopeptide (TPR) repeat protein
MVFMAPFLSDKARMFREVGRQLDATVTNLSALEQKNYYQKIMNGLQRALDKNELNEAACLLLGKAYWLKARIETAPESRELLVNKAILYLRKGFALLRADQFGEGHYLLGELYFDRGENYYFEALKEYQKAKRMRWHATELDSRMAYIYLTKGQYQVGLKAYQSLLKTAKTPENYHYAGVASYFLSKPDQAEQYLNYAIDLYKDDLEGRYDVRYLVWSFYYLGRIYYDKKIYDIAENYLKKALSLDSDNVEILTGLAGLYKDIRNNTQLREINGRLKKLTGTK